MNKKTLQYQSGKARLKACRMLDRTLHAGGTSRHRHTNKHGIVLLPSSKQELPYSSSAAMSGYQENASSFLNAVDIDSTGGARPVPLDDTLPMPLQKFLAAMHDRHYGDGPPQDGRPSLVDHVLKHASTDEEASSAAILFNEALEEFIQDECTNVGISILGGNKNVAGSDKQKLEDAVVTVGLVREAQRRQVKMCLQLQAINNAIIVLNNNNHQQDDGRKEQQAPSRAINDSLQQRATSLQATVDMLGHLQTSFLAKTVGSFWQDDTRSI
jgi:hypothetical protein